MQLYLDAVHHADTLRIHAGPKADLQPTLMLYALLPRKRKLKPASMAQVTNVQRAAKQLKRARHPAEVLAAQQDPDGHHHRVGVAVGDLQLEATRLGVGDVEAASLKTLFDLTNIVDLENVAAPKFDIGHLGLAVLEEVWRED